MSSPVLVGQSPAPPAPGESNLLPTAPRPVAETSTAAVAAREKAAIEARHILALRCPRDLEQVSQRFLAACQRPAFAEGARYAKPVGKDKFVEGASIRFAEEGARAYGNLDITTTLVFDDPLRRTFRVQVVDLESLLTYATEVEVEKTVERRSPRQGDTVLARRTNSSGQEVYLVAATEDALRTKQQAYLSIAIRNEILRVIPSWLKEEALAQVDRTLKDVAKQDPEVRLKKALNAFAELRVTPADLAAYLGHPVGAGTTTEELVDLARIYTAIKDGETTWVAVLEAKGRQQPGAPAASAPGAEGLKASLGLQDPPPAAAADPDLALDQQLARGDA